MAGVAGGSADAALGALTGLTWLVLRKSAAAVQLPPLLCLPALASLQARSRGASRGVHRVRPPGRARHAAPLRPHLVSLCDDTHAWHDVLRLRQGSCPGQSWAQHVWDAQVLAVADTHHRHALPGLMRLSALQALHYLSLHKVPRGPPGDPLHSMPAGGRLRCCCHACGMLLRRSH